MNPNDRFPPALSAFTQSLDAQPEPVRSDFHYCLARLMVETGKVKLVETRPGEAGGLCV
jgi:hypothetical protein